TDDLLRRADYNRGAGKVKIIVVECRVKDSSSCASTQEDQRCQLATTHLVVIVTWIILWIRRASGHRFPRANCSNRASHVEFGNARVSCDVGHALDNINCKRSGLAAINNH